MYVVRKRMITQSGVTIRRNASHVRGGGNLRLTVPANVLKKPNRVVKDALKNVQGAKNVIPVPMKAKVVVPVRKIQRNVRANA